MGALLYESLTGTAAYPGDDDVAILSRVQRGEHQPLDAVPESFRALVGRCLEKSPQQRIGSADELRQLLIPASGSGSSRWESRTIAQYLGSRFHPIVLPPPVPGAEVDVGTSPGAAGPAPAGRGSSFGPWLALTLLLLPILLALGAAVLYLAYRG